MRNSNIYTILPVIVDVVKYAPTISLKGYIKIVAMLLIIAIFIGWLIYLSIKINTSPKKRQPKKKSWYIKWGYEENELKNKKNKSLSEKPKRKYTRKKKPD